MRFRPCVSGDDACRHCVCADGASMNNVANPHQPLHFRNKP
jgi:hypothetical protein